MPTPPQHRDDDDEHANVLAGVSVEPDFDYSWLSKDSPCYEDVGEGGQLFGQGDDESPSSGQ